MAAGKVAFQIRKYSWSVDNTGNGKANYKHLTADNLFLVLEGEQSVTGKLSLRFVHGVKVLDDIDLAKHIDIATSTRETFRRINRHVSDKQLPTYAVTSGVKLAITHRPEDGLVRRMQVAMLSMVDCSKVVEFLKFRGMTFVEAARRPGTADSDLRSINTTTSFFTTPGNNSFEATSRSQPLHDGHHSSGSQRAGSMLANSVSASTQPSTGTFLRDENTAPRILKLENPTSAQVFARQPQTSKSVSASTGLASDSDALTSSKPALFRMTSAQTSSTSLYSHSDQQDSEQAHETTYGSVSWSASRSIDDLLPPERELPFDLTRRERSRSSSVLSLTALPKPQLKKTGSVQSESSSVIMYTSESAAKSKRQRIAVDMDTEASETPSKRVLRNNMPPPQIVLSSENSRSSPRDMNELLYGKRPRQNQPVLGNTSTTSEQNDQKSGLDNGELPCAQSSSNLTATTERIVQSSPSVDLHDYAQLSLANRTEMLERFMIDMLGNNDFATLCEDMSMCWQKLALGQ